MATVNGLVTVYESSDGGTGNAEDTFWVFFVESDPTTPGNRVPVNTKNFRMAETIRLAIKTGQKVTVTFDDEDAEGRNRISQARIEFKNDE